MMKSMMGGGGKAARAEKKEAKKDVKETRQLIKSVAPKGLNKEVKDIRKARLKAEKVGAKLGKALTAPDKAKIKSAKDYLKSKTNK